MSISVVTLALAIVCASLLALWFKTPNQSSLPPGPPADPIIGHLRAIPTRDQGRVFYSWSKLYGDVIQLRLPATSLIVLNSVRAANDLLDKNGANFSCRPKCLVFELMGWVPNTAFLQYGTQLTKHRKIFQRWFSKQESLSYQPIQHHQACVLVKNLMGNPQNYDECFRRYTTAVIIKIAYGHDIVSDDDHFLKITDEIGSAINNSGPVGNTPVDWIPILQHFPSWFPGTRYANHARKWRPTVRRLHDDPVDKIQREMTEHNAPSCLITNVLEESPEMKEPHNIDDIKGVAATMYGAGVDTTWSALGVFLLNMVLHPEIVRKAQDEIDSVVGFDRLPQFSDREKLPYIEAIVQETFRWYPVVPLGVPHRSLRDEVYRDMFIPKGSTVFANLRGMSLDENTYKDPEAFNPDRFIPRPGYTPEPFFPSVFGFGRRICPGRFLADASLFIAAACILSVFDISKALGPDGKEIEPEIEFTTGIVDHLKQIPCVIRPRSPKHEILISHISQ